MQRLVSLAGIFVLLGFAWLLSADRRNMNWRVVGWGIGLQLLFGVFIFLLPVGPPFLLAVNDVVVRLLDASMEGTEFLFGRLALSPGMTSASGETSLAFMPK